MLKYPFAALRRAGHIPFFGIAERPNLIALDIAGRYIAYQFIVQSQASLASVNEEFGHGVDGDSDNTGYSPHIEEPSTNILRIWIRLAVGSLFMP